MGGRGVGHGNRGLLYHVLAAVDGLISGVRTEWLGGVDGSGVPGGVIPAMSPSYAMQVAPRP